MSTHNIYFRGYIRKLLFGYSILSGAILRLYSVDVFPGGTGWLFKFRTPMHMCQTIFHGNLNHEHAFLKSCFLVNRDAKRLKQILLQNMPAFASYFSGTVLMQYHSILVYTDWKKKCDISQQQSKVPVRFNLFYLFAIKCIWTQVGPIFFECMLYTEE